MRSVLPATVAMALLLALPIAPAAQKKEDPLASERRKLEQTQKQLREEREKAADAKRRETSLLAELEKIDRRLAEKQQDIARLDGRIQRAQTDVYGLRGEIRKLEASRGGQQDALARRLRTIYKIHNQGAALPLILADDTVKRAAVVRQLGSVAALDARVIREYRSTTDQLAERKGREETRQSELAALRAEAKREQAEVDREAARRRVLLAKVKDERAYHERMVGELTEASRRLEAFMRDLQAKQRRVAKATPPAARPPGDTPRVGFGELRGRLPWPTAGRVLTSFGAQVHPRFGTKTFRNGVDIEAAEGTDVTAVYAGHVVFTGWFKGYGNLIILDHGHEYYTLYAHVAEILVKEGDDVRQAQRIGTVGDTGSLAGPRLYFEVRFQGKPQDPEQWLRQRS
jgi:murein hydrolase activator